MNIEEKLKEISEIKSMMENSSKFLSLSGLSGIFAGFTALISAGVFYAKNQSVSAYGDRLGISEHIRNYEMPDIESFVSFTVMLAIITLVTALGFVFYFTYRKAKKRGYRLSGKITKLLLINMFIPLIAGGLFSIILLYYGIYFLVGSVTLMFYGLALVNASKYTLRDVRYLGILEIALGLIAAIFADYSLIFWAIGFGVLHIIYGISMYLKYDR